MSNSYSLIWGIRTIQLEWPSAPNREFDRTPTIALKPLGIPHDETSKCWQPQVTNSLKSSCLSLISIIYIYIISYCICKSSARMSQEMLRFFVCSCFLCSTKQNLAWIAHNLTSCHQWCPNSALSQNRILTVPSKGLGILMISSWKKWWFSRSWCIELGSESDSQILLKKRTLQWKLQWTCYKTTRLD